MSTSNHREVEIFTAVQRLPPGERAAYLATACGGNESLRLRIEELLKTQEHLAGFMEQGADPALHAFPREGSGEKSGQRIGRYQLIEKIGEGGCGVIYLAEQAEPVRRQVALKIIKPGMDTKEVIARFEAERQALALMDHPGIAKVFDAGETEAGRPYFVMELIRGIKITEYCDRHALTTGERLQLFVLVCQAVQHAHQKGIIHRDLKPSNILVTTTPEGAANPVVIDFGIAKATTDLRLTDKTLFTALAMFVGTPAYMSPEQIDAKSADVDTRTDIYSLGVLLYEMLTGSTPFEAGELMKLGLDEVRRVLREQEPIRPSTRLSKMTGGDLTAVARRRRAEAPALIRTVRGDLDWIAMKALEKDRSRRYGTATGLALDIERFLSDEAVSARPASRWYRFQKTYARNRLLFSGLAIIAVLLVGSLFAVSTSLVRQGRARAEAEAARNHAEAAQTQAEAAQKQAETERTTAQLASKQSQQVSRFLMGMLAGYRTEKGKKYDNALYKEILDTTAARATTELSTVPAARAELQTTIASAYRSLTFFPEATAMFRAAAISTREAVGDHHLSTAVALDNLAGMLLFRQEFAEAESLYRESLAIRRSLHGTTPHPDVAMGLRGLSALLWETDRQDEAEKLIREAWQILKAQAGENAKDTITTLYGLSIANTEQLNYAEAEKMIRHVHAAWSKPTELNPQSAEALRILTYILSRAGKSTQSEAVIRSEYSRHEQAYKMAANDVAAGQRELAVALLYQGRYEESEAAARVAYSGMKSVLGPEHLKTGAILEPLSLALEGQKKFDEAETTARAFFELNLKYRAEKGPIEPPTIRPLVSILADQKKFTEADRLLAEYFPDQAASARNQADFLVIRAKYRARLGRWDEALADARTAFSKRSETIEYHRVLAPLLLLHGDAQAHAALVAAELDRFGKTETPIMAAWLVMDAAIAPSASLDLERIDRLATLAVNGGMDGSWAAYAQLGRALADYRRGHFPEAAAGAEKCLESPAPAHRVMAGALLALARQNMDQPAEAAAALTKATAIAAAELPATDGQDFGDDWMESMATHRGAEWKSWIYSRALLAEATSRLPLTAP